MLCFISGLGLTGSGTTCSGSALTWPEKLAGQRFLSIFRAWITKQKNHFKKSQKKILHLLNAQIVSEYS